MDPSGRRLEGSILTAVEESQWQTGDLAEALETAQKSTALKEQQAAGGHTSIRLNLAEQYYLEGMILGKQDAEPSLQRTSDALPKLRKGLEIADELASKDPNEERSRQVVAEIGLEVGNILRHSHPREALSIYDQALARMRETKSNPGSQQVEADLLAASSYAARRVGLSKDADRRISEASNFLRDSGAYPADKVEPMSEADHLLRAQADEYAATRQATKAVETYQLLLDKLMAWKPDLQNDLRDATCISRTWTALAQNLRRAGRAEEAARMESQRSELLNHWKSKLPNGEFLLRQSLQQAFDKT